MYQKRTNKKTTKDAAVSPVVGVMLMLVVTIVIAAVVAAFASGMITTTTSTPTAALKTTLTEDSLSIYVDSLSESIPSSDLKIILTTDNGQSRTIIPNAEYGIPFGFNIAEGVSTYNQGKSNTYLCGIGIHDSVSTNESKNKLNWKATDAAAYQIKLTKPINWSDTEYSFVDNSVQRFGKYTLKTGTTMSASGEALEFGLHGNASIPEELKPLFGTSTQINKGDLYGTSMTSDMWDFIFGSSLTTSDLGSNANVLKIKAGTSIDSTELQNGVFKNHIDGSTHKTKYALWAKTDDTNWSFGSTCTYGDGNGYINAFTQGSTVTVNILHIPSGQLLYTKQIVVKGDA